MPFGADSPVKHASDTIAWNKRATALLPKVVDRASADLYAAELVDLVKEREALYARSRNFKSWERTKDEKEAFEREVGKELRESTARYIDAVKPFDTAGKHRNLVPYLIERHSIDIGRMKPVKK